MFMEVESRIPGSDTTEHVHLRQVYDLPVYSGDAMTDVLTFGWRGENIEIMSERIMILKNLIIFCCDKKKGSMVNEHVVRTEVYLFYRGIISLLRISFFLCAAIGNQ